MYDKVTINEDNICGVVDGSVEFDLKRYQILRIEFVNGKHINIMLPAFILDEEKNVDFQIKSIHISKPRNVSEGSGRGTKKTKKKSCL